jgi:hypothetical protein
LSELWSLKRKGSTPLQRAKLLVAARFPEVDFIQARHCRELNATGLVWKEARKLPNYITVRMKGSAQDLGCSV